MNWEQIAEARSLEIKRLHRVCQEQRADFQKEIDNLKAIIAEAKLTAAHEQDRLSYMYDEQGRTDTADYAVNYCIDHILWALDPQATHNEHPYCPCQTDEKDKEA